MSKSQRIVLVLAVLAMVTAGARFVTLPHEPGYQSHRLNQWLELAYPYHWDMYNGDTYRAREALHAIGKRAIPTLLAMLQARDPPLKLRLMKLAEKQSLVKTHFTYAATYRERGIAGFQGLGEEAKEALPELVRLFHVGETNTTWVAALAMARMGPEAVGILREGLTNQYEWTRAGSAVALSHAGSNAWAAVPDLVGRLKDESSHVREWAAYSLGKIGQQAEIVVPALVGRLEDPVPSVSQAAVRALAEFGGRATVAVPALRKAASETEGQEGALHYTITNALHDIEVRPEPDGGQDRK